MSRAPQKRLRCLDVDSLPLSAWREMAFPAYRRRQDAKCSDYIHFCFRAYGPRFGQFGGSTVYDSKCPAAVSHGQNARDAERRVHAYLNGDPATQRGAPGMTESTEVIRPPRPPSPPGASLIAPGLIWRRNRRVSSSTWRCPCVVRFSTKSAVPPAGRTQGRGR